MGDNSKTAAITQSSRLPVIFRIVNAQLWTTFATNMPIFLSGFMFLRHSDSFFFGTCTPKSLIFGVGRVKRSVPQGHTPLS